MPNVTPLAALALFGGVYFDKRVAFILPLLAMVISDSIIGTHQSMVFVYGSFVFTTLVGTFIRSQKRRPVIIGASLISSVVFFLVTNLGFWLSNDLYPKTVAGQMAAYINALPFFRNTLLGDLFYTTLFFGGYEVINAIRGGKIGSANLHKNR
jgi:hypothetical protein